MKIHSEYQLQFPAQSIETAGSKGKPLLEGAQAKLGSVPNMYAHMVNSPGLLRTYLTGYEVFRNESGFTPPEQEVVFLTISRENGCEYCVLAHTAGLKGMGANDAEIVKLMAVVDLFSGFNKLLEGLQIPADLGVQGKR